MRCPKCGIEVQKNTKFCPKCGCNLEEYAAAEQKKAQNRQNKTPKADAPMGKGKGVAIITVAATVLIVAVIAAFKTGWISVSLVKKDPAVISSVVGSGVSGEPGSDVIPAQSTAEISDTGIGETGSDVSTEDGDISPVDSDIAPADASVASETESTGSQLAGAFCPKGVNCYYFNGHTYAQFDYTERNLEKSYSAWEAYCESLGGHLATITSAEENAAVYNLIQKEGLTLAFFGYSDENSEGNWEWITGETSTYSNWAAGQPNNGANDKKGRAQNYAQFSKQTADGQWDDAAIGVDSWHFVCEWDQTVETEQ